jgi:Predicted RNA-binding protein
MCEANVYLQADDGKTNLFLDAVDTIIPQEDGKLYLENIYGERKTIFAKIKRMELVDHNIYLKQTNS